MSKIKKLIKEIKINQFNYYSKQSILFIVTPIKRQVDTPWVIFLAIIMHIIFHLGNAEAMAAH